MKFHISEDGEHIVVEHQCTRPADWPPVVAQLPNGPHGWIITNRDPLTVTPSIHCTECDAHGFITDGEWKVA